MLVPLSPTLRADWPAGDSNSTLNAILTNRLLHSGGAVLHVRDKIVRCRALRFFEDCAS
jgi:hypothetical protein